MNSVVTKSPCPNLRSICLLIGCKKLRSLLMSFEDDTEEKSPIKALNPENDYMKSIYSQLSTGFESVISTGDLFSLYTSTSSSTSMDLKIRDDALQFDGKVDNIEKENKAEVMSGNSNVGEQFNDVKRNDDLGDTVASVLNANINDKYFNEKSLSLKSKKTKGNGVETDLTKMKNIDTSKSIFQQCLCDEIELLLEKLNSHQKKIQSQVNHFSKCGNQLSQTDLLLPSRTNHLGSEKELCAYWTELAVLNGRLDSLSVCFKNKEEILLYLTDLSIDNNKGLEGKVDIDNRSERDKKNKKKCKESIETEGDIDNKSDSKSDSGQKGITLNRTNKTNTIENKENVTSSNKHPSEKPSLNSLSFESPSKSTKQRQLNMRSSSNIRTNHNYGSVNGYNSGYGYSGDNRTVMQNTRGYPFGYNNHFISGNNYYGYPPYYIQQENNSNFATIQVNSQCGEFRSGGQNPGVSNYSNPVTEIFEGGEGEEKIFDPDAPEPSGSYPANFIRFSSYFLIFFSVFFLGEFVFS